VALEDSTAGKAFRAAAIAHQTYLAQDAVVSFLLPPWLSMNMSSTQEAVLRSVDPETTITARVQESVRKAGDAETPDAPVETPGDPLEPILDAPDFPQ